MYTLLYILHYSNLLTVLAERLILLPVVGRIFVCTSPVGELAGFRPPVTVGGGGEGESEERERGEGDGQDCIEVRIS